NEVLQLLARSSCGTRHLVGHAKEELQSRARGRRHGLAQLRRDGIDQQARGDAQSEALPAAEHESGSSMPSHSNYSPSLAHPTMVQRISAFYPEFIVRDRWGKNRGGVAAGAAPAPRGSPRSRGASFVRVWNGQGQCPSPPASRHTPRATIPRLILAPGLTEYRARGDSRSTGWRARGGLRVGSGPTPPIPRPAPATRGQRARRAGVVPAYREVSQENA